MAMCGRLHSKRGSQMATNLAIDEGLIEAAQQIGHHVTKKAAVTAALNEYISRRKQLEILELSGTIDYEPGYDYKKVRKLDRIEAEK
jgi:Arc/MetJ family transcription regulator